MYALPTRFGGLGIDNPVADSANKYAEARKTTAALSNLIKRKETELRIDQKTQRAIRNGIKKRRDGRHEEARDALMKDFRDPRMRRALELAGRREPQLSSQHCPLSGMGSRLLRSVTTATS